MKSKVLYFMFFMMCFCIFPGLVKAECSANEKVQLNTQASYLTYSYTYNNNNTFNVTFENVTSGIALEYDDKVYNATKNGITIKKVPEGTVMFIKVIASPNTNCYEDLLRAITYRIPYYNHYLTSAECQNYPEVEFCQTKFLSYYVSENVFKRMFEKQKEELYQPAAPPVEPEETWFDIVLDYLWKYGMQVGLFIVGFTCMFILGHNAVKRAKAKF